MNERKKLQELYQQNKISRREFMRRAALLGVTAAGASTFLAACGSQPAPAPAEQEAPAESEAEAPAEAPKPEELVVVYWTVDGDEAAVEDINSKFQSDYGVEVRWERTPNIEETWQKILSMSVAEEQLDLFVLHYYNMGAWIKEGVVQPIDGLPGLDEYMTEMPAAARDLVQFQGKIWGLPYFRSLYTNMYNKVLWEQTGITDLPATWEEVGEVSQKVKADGVVEYPIVWQAGVGREHINDTWYMLTGSVGGRLFDDELNPLMEEGSQAREMLKWWRQTFIDWEVADPSSLELRWIPAAKAQGTGEHLFSNTQERFVRFAQIADLGSAAPGEQEIFKVGSHTFSGHVWALGANAFDKDYSWNLLQYYGGKTKDGDYRMSFGRAKYAFTSGWPLESLEDPEVAELWGEVFSVEEYKRQWEDIVFIGTTVPAMTAPWYAEWVDQTVVPTLQKCLGGELDADEACGQIAKAAEDLKAKSG
jgi:hypothetical protein